ncbi:MAG: cupin domain-containing protein [Planctomycetaceae bacterium]
MSPFVTMQLRSSPKVTAPDGSDVHILPGLTGGGMAHFQLPAGQVTRAVEHRTVEEIWYVVSGEGELWRRMEGTAEVTSLRAGVAVTIPLGTQFQFRTTGSEPLQIIAITMPPWPGEGEAMLVNGCWEPTVSESAPC